MAPNIKNEGVAQLVDKIVLMTGASTAEAVHRALEERRQRLTLNPAGRPDEARL